MKKKLLVTGSIFFILFVGFLANGCRHGGFHSFNSPEEKMEFVLDHISGALDLTNSQEVKVKAIFEEFHAKMKKGKAENKEGFNSIVEMIKRENVDKEKLSELCDAKIQQITDMKPFFIEKFVELHEILTPEQREILAKKMKKFHEKMGN